MIAELRWTLWPGEGMLLLSSVQVELRPNPADAMTRRVACVRSRSRFMFEVGCINSVEVIAALSITEPLIDNPESLSPNKCMISLIESCFRDDSVTFPLRPLKTEYIWTINMEELVLEKGSRRCVALSENEHAQLPHPW
jgi:hypothetical protein